ncbi:Spy/CpxP family protein refolding chaperone [Fibrella arboris]|uniref:Spy/CpxP family protein refolding chaperone n=1 Tax=Fibrella arboris TaxID=3242486 RepID=UPI00351F96FB
METKRNYYWLWAAIGFLLCLNLLTVGWVMRRTNSLRATRQLPESVLIRRLDLSPGQVKLYRQSRKQLRLQSKPHEDSLRTVRAILLDQLKRPAVTEEELDRIWAQMARQNGQIVRLRFRHWQQVRSFCTPPQQKQFDQLIRRVGQGLNNPGLRGRLPTRLGEINE